MGPIAADDELVGTKIEEWLASSNELFVELYQPHSGGPGQWYMVSSCANFAEMVAGAPFGAVFFVVREKQFPIRGTVDDAFIKRALKEIKEGEWYVVTQSEFYPAPLSLFGTGNSHIELRADLENLRGTAVCLGKEPNLPDQYWAENNDEGIIIAMKSRRLESQSSSP